VPLSREECPPPEAILQVLEKSIAIEKREKVIDHIVKCAYCLQEFELLLGFVRGENEMAEEISSFLEGKVGGAPPPRKKPKIGARISRLSPQFFSTWRIAAVSMAMIIIAGLLLILINPILKPALDKERGKARAQVRLLSPLRGQTGALPLVFRWQEVEGAELYQMEVFDKSLLLLWRSPQIEEHTLELPTAIMKTLEENTVYFWMVTAFFPDGIEKESQLGTFILAKIAPGGHPVN